MTLFESIHPDFFKPLSGGNRQKYAGIIMCLWEICKRTATYGEEKRVVVDAIDSYLVGSDDGADLDKAELADLMDTEDANANTRVLATAFLRRLKATGWLEEQDGGYEEEPQIVVNHRIVPIVRSFRDVISPQLTMYKGKLFKIYRLLQEIGGSDSPYESILREVSSDMDDLNTSLRQLSSSIGTYMDELTRGKTPQEILTLFDTYEEKVVVGAYHRFKTNDNLFYYRSELLEQLEHCRTTYYEALIKDCCIVEQIAGEEAARTIGNLVFKVQEDVHAMSNIMKVIDERHILYRTRAVQRAQFLLLSDGTIKSKIGQVLQYYAIGIETTGDLYAADEGVTSHLFQFFPQNYFDAASIKPPIDAKRPTPISTLAELIPMDPQLIAERQEQLMLYVKSAVTAENVNHFIHKALKNGQATTASALVNQYYNSDDLVKIIGLHTYSKSKNREFDIVVKPNFVVCQGLRFQDFTVRERG